MSTGEEEREHAARVQQTTRWVKERIAGHDSSHDWWHVERVTKMAARLGAAEGLSDEEQRLAELAALLHDVADHKYSADPAADRAAVLAFLSADLALPPRDVHAVSYVINSMGFKEELARQAQREEGQQQREGQGREQQQKQVQQHPCCGCNGAAGGGGASSKDEEEEARRRRVLAMVQDADRLDAIGAIGIARCLTFGGRFGRVLHEPSVAPRERLSAEEYGDKAAAARQTTLNHFHEKLFKLKDLMLTAAGRRMAEERHAYMQAFLQRFLDEWEAAA